MKSSTKNPKHIENLDKTKVDDITHTGWHFGTFYTLQEVVDLFNKMNQYNLKVVNFDIEVDKSQGEIKVIYEIGKVKENGG